MFKMISYLNNPGLVSNIQRKFGIVYIKSSIQDEQIYNYSNNNKKNAEDENITIHKVKLRDNHTCCYSINNYLIFYFFLFITHIGNEIFYILFLPILTWNYDDLTMYLTCISWAISMYLGQVTKDIIKNPRPTTPPVVKIEVKYLLEYGFPSTHAMGAFSISFTLLYLIFDTNIDLNFFLFLSIIAFFICFFVCLSRIYLGMHSLLDILGGLVYSLIICLIFLKIISHNLVDFIKKNFLNGLLISILIIFSCLMYPSKIGKSTARSDTFLIMSCALGLTLGVSSKFALNLEDIGKIRNYDNIVILCLMRSIIGISNIVIGRFLSKKTIYIMVKLKYNFVKETKNNEINEFIKNNYKIEMLSHLFCYTVVSFSAIFTSFILFEYYEIY